MSTVRAENLGKRTADIVFGLLKFAFISFLVPLAAIKGVWEWSVPDLFPGAVQQGLIAPTISWGTTLLIALGIAVFSTFLRFFGLGPESTEPSIRAINAKLDAIAKHLGIDPKVVFDAELIALIKCGKKIDAIKWYQGYAGVDLAEAKAYIEGLERNAKPGVTPGSGGK